MSLPEKAVLPEGLALTYCEGRLVLAGDEKRYGKPLSVDFVTGKAAHRRQFGGGRGQLVAKACGLAKGVTPSVVDATAGLGRDAFVLAALGAHVLLVERVSAIAALLEDGLLRAAKAHDIADIIARMTLRHGDAAQSLEALVAKAAFDPQVVHLDPMFPHREKSALVKKEMRLFRELAGDDDDAPRLLEAALEVATHRVVVKRPRKAPPIAGPAPQHVLEGKTSRYDLYVKQSLHR
ncbi:MAG: class I SAM-dependent methyltransferase [Halomonas sp.]|uniref:class I SAM-dependent methyltransferase n=1 Tax=Halomonas TaxID=2745 RepID=UPI000EC7DF0B|nr:MULTISPECIES: class I SAM-dependent methyltransferase [Halomonas]HCR98691.1 rRNA methyltransferase [Halomonas sp.]